MGNEGKAMTLSRIDWEDLFLSGLCKINEGNQGIILSVDTASQTVFQDARPVGGAARESAPHAVPVIKAGKTATPESAKEEFDKQLRAYEIITSSSVAKTLRVPMLWETGCHRADVGDAALLRKKTGLIGDSVEFLAMEEVPGLDLATFAYQQALLEIIRCDIKEGYPRPMRALLYSLLRYKLANTTAFNDIEDKSTRTDAMRLAGQIRSSMRNANYDFDRAWDDSLSECDKEKFSAICPIQQELALLREIHENQEPALGAYLENLTDVNLLEQAIVDLRPECILARSPEERRRKFVDVVRTHVACRGLLSEELCTVAREAITALHKEGYYHCDLHERNLMISRDRKTIYLIDFGKSNPNGDVSGDAHNYHRFDGEGPDDFSILSPAGGLLYSLTRNPE